MTWWASLIHPSMPKDLVYVEPNLICHISVPCPTLTCQSNGCYFITWVKTRISRDFHYFHHRLVGHAGPTLLLRPTLCATRRPEEREELNFRTLHFGQVIVPRNFGLLLTCLEQFISVLLHRPIIKGPLLLLQSLITAVDQIIYNSFKHPLHDDFDLTAVIKECEDRGNKEKGIKYV